ncbi:MAG: PH domain-containing protein [Nocardioidaceae bacterium]|nr:MAG: PH domain-containing protein [Nocardioidaceae bacterium]
MTQPEPTDPGEQPAQPAQAGLKRLSPLSPFVRSWIFFVALLGITWQNLGGGETGPIIVLLIVVVLVGLIYGFFSWLLTKYWIDGAELRIETGVISRQSRRIRIDRLQGVDVVQPMVARILGLAELRFDVAGGKAEGTLAFLPLAEADELRTVLLSRRDIYRAPTASLDAANSDTAQSSEQAAPAQPAPERELARVDPGLLIASTALTPQFIALALAAGAFGVLSSLGGSFGAGAGVVPVLIGFGVMVFRRINRFYKYAVTDSATGLHLAGGLLERASQTIVLHRVQGVVVSEPLMWRALGWARLEVSVAGASSDSDDETKRGSTVLPVANRDEVLDLAQHLLSGLDFRSVPLTPPPGRAHWLAPIGAFFQSAGQDETTLVSRSGWFDRRTMIAPHRRAQSLTVQQGPLQRLLRLADLRVDSPPGPVSVRFQNRDQDWTRADLEVARQRAGAARRAAFGP